MRAVDVRDGAGPASSLFINTSVERPVPKPTECLIKVRAFGLNRADTLQRQGRYPIPPGASQIMGLEFSGTVEEVGSDTSTDQRHNWKHGDEVFGLAYGGCYAEFVAVSKKMLIRKPSQLSWEVCAGIPEVYFTALQALHLVGEFTPGRTKNILWHAGGSSVSIAGIQLSRAANEHVGVSSSEGKTATPPQPPRVFATARKDTKCAFCVEKLGCVDAVNTTDADWVDELLRANNGTGFDLIVDYVGAPYFAPNLKLAARDAHIVTLGLLGGGVLAEKTDISAFLAKRVRYEGSTLRSRDEVYQGKLRDLFEEKVLQGLIDGTFECHVDRVVSWEKIKDAHEALEANETTGKIICLVD